MFSVCFRFRFDFSAKNSNSMCCAKTAALESGFPGRWVAFIGGLGQFFVGFWLDLGSCLVTQGLGMVWSKDLFEFKGVGLGW